MQQILSKLQTKNCQHIINDILTNFTLQELNSLKTCSPKNIQFLIDNYKKYDLRFITKSAIFLNYPCDKFGQSFDKHDEDFNKKSNLSGDDIENSAKKIVYRRMMAETDISEMSEEYILIEHSKEQMPILKLNYIYWLNLNTNFKFNIADLVYNQQLLNPELRKLKFSVNYQVFYDKNNSWCGDHTLDFSLGLELNLYEDYEHLKSKNSKLNISCQRKVFTKSSSRKMVQGKWQDFTVKELVLDFDLHKHASIINEDDLVIVTTSYNDKDCKTSKDNIKWSFVDLIVEGI